MPDTSPENTPEAPVTTRRAPDGWTPGSAEARAVSRAVAPLTYDAEARSVQVTIATPYRVRRWFGMEELAMTETAINLERVARGQCRLLDHHNAYEREAVLGFVTEARVQDGLLVGTIRFADNEAGRAAEKDVASGLMTGISCGYRVNRLVLSEIDESGDDDDVYRAEDWELLEVSLVSVPADPYAGVRSLDPGSPGSPDISPNRPGPAGRQHGGSDMPETAPEAPATVPNSTADDATDAPSPSEDQAMPEAVTDPTPVPNASARTDAAPASAPTPDNGAEAAIRSERARVKELTNIARQADLSDDALDQAVSRGVTADDFRRTALDTLAERASASATSNVNTRGANVTITRDETETRRIGMADALAARMARAAGDRKAEVPEHARQWVDAGIAEVAAECIGHTGPLRTAAQVARMFERAFHTTSDFPDIFVNAMNVRLMARYQDAVPTYRRFCARYTVDDFRPMNVIRAGDFPSLQEVNESGEIKSGTFTESKEQITVKPYGVMLTVTRHMIVNDQLGAIDQVLGSAGARVADWENALAFAALVSNSGAGPTLLDDSVAMFHTSHNNKAGTGAAISVATVGAGRAAMMKQTTLDGMKANFIPRVILTGPDTITTAEQLLTTLTPAQATNAVPASIRSLEPIADANISGNGWYLFADPTVAPNFVYAYLDGFEGPRLTSEEMFTVQGMRVKLEHDFGVAGVDYRGGFRNAGA